MIFPGWEVSRCCLLRTLFAYPGLPGPEGGARIAPDLAAGFPEVSADGLTWTIRIKEGIRYAPPLEDVEVTSRDFVRALERAGTPHPGGYASYFLIVEGFDAYWRGEADTISGVETPDDHTLVIRLTTPTPDLPSRLSVPPVAPIPPNPHDPGARLGVAEGHDYDYGRFLVASGPYMIEGSEEVDFSKPVDEQVPAAGLSPGESLVLVRNPSWDPSTDPIRPALADRIEIAMGFGDFFQAATGTDDEIAELVRSGDLDVALTPVPTDLALRYRDDPEVAERVRLQPTGYARYVSINLAQPPFDDVHVRKAVNFAVDKAALVRLYERLVGLTGEIARHVAPDSAEDYLLVDYDPYSTGGDRGDLERARAEMRLSKYDADGDGVCDDPVCRGPIVGLYFHPQVPAAAASVAEDLAALGIEVDMRPKAGCGDPAAHVALCVGLGWIIDYPHGANWFPGLFEGIRIECPEPYASAGFCENYSLVGASPEQLEEWGYPVREVPTVDDRIARCMAQVGEAQFGCWADLDRYVMEQVVPWVPFLLQTAAHAFSPRVTAFTMDEFTRLPALDRIAVTGEPPGPLPALARLEERSLPPGEPGIPDGTYSAEITLGDAIAAGMPAEPKTCESYFGEAACAVGTYTLTVERGRFTIRSDAPADSCVTGLGRIAPGPVRGVTTTSGTRVVFEERAPCEGFAWVLRGSVSDGLLALQVVAEAALQSDQYMRLIFETHPWERVEG